MNNFCEGCNQRFAPIDQQACWGCKDGALNSSKREITSNNAQNFATGSKDGRKPPENVPETNVGKINGRTPEEIKKGLEVCSTGAGCIQCPYDKPNLCHGIENKADALAYIQQLEERDSKLEYTLLGVMHSVDKWLDVEPYDFDKDDGTVAATRASNAREIALKAIEKAQADLTQVERERDAAVQTVHGLCLHCKNDGSEKCRKCLFWPSRVYFVSNETYVDHWEWRGVCEENTKEE